MVHKGRKAYLKKHKAESNNINCQESQHNKKAKIIVRNLPFKNLSEKSVEELFKEYGDIEEVKLLKKEDGKFVGCGFVQFKKVSSAAKAIHYANQKEVHGRKIIIDWALPKDTFLNKAQKLEEEFYLKSIKSEILSDEEDDKIRFKIEREPDKWANERQSENESEESGNEEDEEDEEEEDDEDDNEDNGSSAEKVNFTKNKFGDQNKNKKNSSEQNHMNTKYNDVEEGKTVFLRNVPFSATNEDLKECVKQFGPVKYALICVDKLTEHSKGTAFVKFKDKESASECIKNSMKIYLNESPLSVTIAVSKENLEKKKIHKNTGKDSRNLYLVHEGVVMAGSKAAAGVSATDMAKRLQLEQWKTQILRNLNMFISKTRLVIHNLPRTYDDSKLKKLFLKYSNSKAIIKEAKVMLDKKKFDSNGNGVSKELGFVSFTNHDDALTALRNINNNPKIFTPKRRPIVAFSIENKAVLNQKQKRVEKSRAKLGIVRDESDKLSKLNRKQRRFIRRRQKIIEQRRESKRLKQEQSLKSETEIEGLAINKLKRKNTEDKVSNKKLKISHSSSDGSEVKSKQFAGVISEPGKKIKLRSRFKLKTQANIHMQTLKKEKRKRKEKEKKKMASMKQPKQKKGKPKLMDDAKLSKLILKHRESIQKDSVFKRCN